MLTQNVFRAVNQLLDDRARCKVCGKRIMVRFDSAIDGRLLIGFSCHGSHQVFTLDVEWMSDVRVVDAIMKFADRVFADEARSPDLRELIAYNRGALPEVRAC